MTSKRPAQLSALAYEGEQVQNMGIARCASKLLLLESKASPFTGAVLQLGRQDIYFSYATLQDHASEMQVTLAPLETITKRKNPYYPDLDSIDDSAFFGSLGFETVHSIDTSSSEGATYIHDLNQPVPVSLHDRYDLIFDGGTMEHIFHIPNVLENIHKMLKVAGKIIHYPPTHNFVDHGFYQFSPTFFHDYYAHNQYEVVTSFLVGHKAPLNHSAEPTLFEYKPGQLDSVSVGGFNKEAFDGCEIFGTFFSAVKTPDSVCGLAPQQGFYRRRWALEQGRTGDGLRQPAAAAARRPSRVRRDPGDRGAPPHVFELRDR